MEENERMKTAIVYASKFKGNTRILVDAIAAGNDIDLYNARSVEHVDLRGYDVIGFASGIYYGSPDRSVMKILERDLPRGKKVFFVCTSGSGRSSYVKPLMKEAKKNGAGVAGVYSCRGSVSVPGKSGGKRHPSFKEIRSAVNFYNEMMDRLESERRENGDRAEMVASIQPAGGSGISAQDPEDKVVKTAAGVAAGISIATPLIILQHALRRMRK